MKSLSNSESERLASTAREVRRKVVETLALGGGHFGGSLSVTDILVTLYGAVMHFDPARSTWADRDRLILGKGHSAVALCAVLSQFGFFDSQLLADFGKLDANFGMHPDMHKLPGCDMSTGSIGHGLAVGVGMALAGRADGKDYRVYVVIGDGDCYEGSTWEAAMAASHYKVDNLTVIVDRNRLSIDGDTEQVMALEPMDERWRSFGWQALVIDGHDIRQIYEAVEVARNSPGRPTVLIAQTVKGKGVSFMEGKREYHSAVLSAEQLDIARTELGGTTR